MCAVPDSTMAVDAIFNAIVSEIHLTKLNFTIKLTPYAAYITLKRSTQVDVNGVHAVSSQPLLTLLQETQRNLLISKLDNTRLKSELNSCEMKLEELKLQIQLF